MFIRNLDYISPPITLYHEGSLSHSSIVSGILSIMSFILNNSYCSLFFFRFNSKEKSSCILL